MPIVTECSTVGDTLAIWLVLWAHGAFCGIGIGAHVLDLWWPQKSLARCACCAHESKCVVQTNEQTKPERST